MSDLAALNRFGRRRAKRVRRLTRLWGTPRINTRLILALGLRESGLRNIVDFSGGHDRGVWQINSYWHAAFLDSVPGCANGTWKAVYRSALPAGRVPTLKHGLRRAIKILRDGMRSARRSGVPWRDRVRVALAAYNAGYGAAIKGYREGDVDKYTTGRDYSADVLRRQATVKRWL